MNNCVTLDNYLNGTAFKIYLYFWQAVTAAEGKVYCSQETDKTGRGGGKVGGYKQENRMGNTQYLVTLNQWGILDWVLITLWSLCFIVFQYMCWGISAAGCGVPGWKWIHCKSLWWKNEARWAEIVWIRALPSVGLWQLGWGKENVTYFIFFKKKITAKIVILIIAALLIMKQNVA